MKEITAIQIPVNRIDQAAAIIAEAICKANARNAKPLSPAPEVVSPEVVSPEVELTPAEQAEIQSDIEQAEREANSGNIPFSGRGLRLLSQIHCELIETMNASRKAEFDQYHGKEDRFIPLTKESENLISLSRTIQNQVPESWEDAPLTKSQKRKQADTLAALTYKGE